MKVTLLGYRVLDFTPNEAGAKPVEGTKVFFAHSADGVKGKISGACFISVNMLDVICFNMDEYLGQEVDAEFNSKGKIVGLTLIHDVAA